MKARYIKNHLKIAIGAIALALTLSVTGCSGSADTNSAEAVVSTEETEEVKETAAEAPAVTAHVALTRDDVATGDTIENAEDGAHAIEADGTTESYANTEVKKTGDSEGDEADFYGENAAVFATNGATLDMKEMVITSNGAHANGVFSYGEGTTVTVSDSLIETEGNCSGGLMTTGGGTTQADHVTIHTSGNSSAAIRSDRGGGTVNVTNSYATTTGKGSPAIYSTADITVEDSYLEASGSQGVVVEGSNSVTLKNVDMVADNTEKNSDKSEWYQAVMIYQSQSGDAAEGLGSFTMEDGSLVNKNGEIFFVNNTVAEINLTDAEITNEDSDGLFLRAAAAGWGQEGSNGGLVTLNASKQEIDGDILVDEVSVLNLYLKDASSFTGAVNCSGEAGEIYVELDGDSTWTLTGDSYIKSLTCDADAIDLNGYTLYVDGEAYSAGTVSEGEAITIEVKESSGRPGEPPEGMGGHKPDGNGGPGEPPEGMDGQRPDGNGGPGERPEGMNGQRLDGNGGPGEPPEGMGGQRPDGNGGPGERPEGMNGLKPDEKEDMQAEQ